MSLETQLTELISALKDNATALREILAAGAPTTVAIPTPEPTKPATKKAAKTTPAPAPEPEPAAETPTRVAVTEAAAEEFSDPLDPETTVVVKGSAPAIDPDAVITEITDTWKALLTSADADRKTELKDQFPALRAKWGLADGAKLATLSGTPEKLVGLLNDIKAL